MDKNSNSQKRGQGIWLPLKFHKELPEKYTIKDSFLAKRGKQYFLHLCVNIPDLKIYNPETAIGIDLGIKNLVTHVNITNKHTQFLGKEVNKTRGKYYYIRKQLGKKKKFSLIKKMKNNEKNKINTLLHTISKVIVTQAHDEKAVLFLGKLKTLQRKKMGRAFNRKLGTFAYRKLSYYIEYKAKEYGVPFQYINEAYTSKTCHVCGMRGKRTKNWFQCLCGYADNADRNAAFNIGKRGLSYKLGSGVVASAQRTTHSL